MDLYNSSEQNKIVKAKRYIDRLPFDGVFKLAEFVHLTPDDLAINKDVIKGISVTQGAVGTGNFVGSADIYSMIHKLGTPELQHLKKLVDLELESPKRN